MGDWESRYEHLLSLGGKLVPLSKEEMNAKNKVDGCASQVWLVVACDKEGHFQFRGASDSHLVSGLIALLLIIYNGKKADEILALNIREIFKRLDLEEHLTAQRSNGFFSMVSRIWAEAEKLDAVASP